MQTVAKAIDAVVGLRQFEISGPMPATLGKSNNYPRSVMQRLGAQPARAVLEPVGGQGPQKLVTEFAGAIATGEIDVAMILGSNETLRRSVLMSHPMEGARRGGLEPERTGDRGDPHHQ